MFEDVQCIEDWTGEDHNGEPFFYYRQRCKLYRGDRFIASADGSCNSWEKKYRYRQSTRVCPACGKETIIKGKAEYGGGWVCFAKKGGCGSKYSDGDPAIEGQQAGQIKNPDIAEQVNTILKMAQKRALVAATLIATGASDYFTQDLDDFVIEGNYHESAPEQPPAPPPAPTHKQPPASAPQASRFNPVAVLVDGGVAESNYEAAAILNRYAPKEAKVSAEALLAWGKLYRAWRDQGSDPEAAAKNATEGIPVE